MVVIQVSTGERMDFLVSQVDICAERVKNLFIRRSLSFGPGLGPDFEWDAYWLANESFFLAPRGAGDQPLMMPNMVDTLLPANDFGVVMTLLSLRKYGKIEHALTQRQMMLTRQKYHLLMDYAKELGYKELLDRAKIIPFKKAK